MSVKHDHEHERKEHMMSRLQHHQQPHGEGLALFHRVTLDSVAHQVGPGKDTHGTPVPDREGRGWPATSSTRRPPTNDNKP